MSEFVHLHCHSQYSMRDGVASVEELVCAAKSTNMPAIALTDHGNMFGLIPFYKACKKNNENEQEIKPIIGVEAYVAVFNMRVKTTKIECTHRPLKPGQKFPFERHHLTLLAQNITGYRNLVQLVSKSYTEGFYKQPRMDKDLLRQHSEGLIGMSACMAGEVGYFLSRGNKQATLQTIRAYQNIFDGRFFLELMPHNNYGRLLIEVAEESGTELVVTQDVHYINRADSEIQKVIGFYGKKKRQDWPDYNYDLSFKTREEMEKAFQDYPKDIIRRALDNTVKIADQCNVELPFLEIKDKDKDSSFYPRYHGLKSASIDEENQEANELLHHLVMDKVQARGLTEDQVVMTRIEKELKVIFKHKLSSYFLAEADILENAGNDRPIFCNARGSASGSYITYILGITQLNPIEHELLFERFLNEDRYDMPDIDIDVEDGRRQEIFDYVTKTYGQDRVARVSSFSTVKARYALKLSASYLGLPENVLNEIHLMMVDQIKILESQDKPPKKQIDICVKELSSLQKRMAEDTQIRRMVELAARVEGHIFGVSLHPAGILVSRNPLNELVPFWQRNNEIAVQVGYKNAKDIGLKYDFLLSKALTVIRETTEQVKQIHGTKIDIEMLPTDSKVYELIGTGHTTTIFQLNTDLAKRVSAQVKPSDFGELSVLNAMLRPAPIKDGKVNDYIEKKATGNFEHKIKECTPILRETKGVLFLQEQIMRICVDVAGFNWADADDMRSLLGKKNPEDSDKQKLEPLAKRFKEGVIAKGYSEEQATELLDELTSFSKYCFNKSHCVSYARLIYITAYLKLYYPEIYMCSWLNHANVKDDRIDYLNECKRLGIRLLSPDINKSAENFILEMDSNNIAGIRFGLGHIKDVASRAGEMIKEKIASGEYLNFQDFLARISAIKNEKDNRLITSKHIEALAKAGAFDSFAKDRNILLRYCRYENITRRRSAISKIRKQTKQSIRVSRGFCETDREALISFISMPTERFTPVHKTKYEVEFIGTYLPSNIAECVSDNGDYLFLPPIEKILKSPSGTLFKVLGFIEEIGPEKRNRYNQLRIPLILGDPSGKLKLNLDKFKFRPILQHLAVGNIVSVLASTEITRLKGEYIRFFHPKRIEILG